MRRLRLLSALAVAWTGLATLGPAAPPVEADPTQLYPVTRDAGPWLVCAASYSGPEAKELARQLVHWIRTKVGIPAFTFNRADEERKRLNEEYARRGLKKSVRIEDQYAILVGGYGDDKTASQARDVVRNWPIPDLKLSSGKSALDREITGELDLRTGTGRQTEGKPVSPFRMALVIRNPTLPRPNLATKLEPFVKALNDGEEYSLLGNPKPWTLAVKQYTGATAVTDQPTSAGIFEKWFGKSRGEALDAAERQAHETARVLRKLGFQAYVFHTRYSSVVTVGGFDASDDPEMDRVRGRLKQLTQQVIANSPTKTDPLQLFPSPPPMEVPQP